VRRRDWRELFGTGCGGAGARLGEACSGALVKSSEVRSYGVRMRVSGSTPGGVATSGVQAACGVDACCHMVRASCTQLTTVEVGFEFDLSN
jgi:hypothetical protein